jgi:hypothetical protein
MNRATNGPLKLNGVAHNVAFIKLTSWTHQQTMSREPGYDIDSTPKVDMAAQGFTSNGTMSAYVTHNSEIVGTE